MENVKLYTEKIYDLLLTYGHKLILAIVVLILGFWITNVITRILARRMEKRKTDVSLQTFFRSMFNILLKTLIVLSVLGMVGIEVTSFIAILGAAGLAVGLALSGTLQNFAGGVMILIFRPWVNTSDYWAVYFDMHENVKKEFDKQGISIPFPQSDVHLFKAN